MRRAFVALALVIAVVLGARAPGASMAIGCSSSGQALSETTCAGCHRAISDRHGLSSHAKAEDSPVFTALRGRAAPEARTFCDRCHSPRHDRGEHGVGCVACHSVVGNQGTVNARFIQGDEDTIQGPTGATGIGAGHRTMRQPFIRSAELCGTCHEVAGGGAFVETPYTEWSASPAHTQGLACATCHMAQVPGKPASGFARGAIAPGVPERDIGDHAFAAVDGGLFDSAASLSLSRNGGRTTITLKNENPGHALPAGARFIRRLTLVATSSDGLRQSWDLGDRMTSGGRETFDALAADGHEVRALGAGAERQFTFDSTAAVEAKLVYRSYDERLLDALALDPSLSSPRVIAQATLP